MDKKSLIESWEKGLTSLLEQLPALQEKETAAHEAVDLAVTEAKSARVARAALQTRINIARQNLEKLGVERTLEAQAMPQGQGMTAVLAVQAASQLEEGALFVECNRGEPSALSFLTSEGPDVMEEYTGLSGEVLRDMQSLDNEPAETSHIKGE